MERIMRYSILIVILGLLIGCGEEDNSPPVINSFMASFTNVPFGSEVILSVLATDPDGDDLAYTYQSTGGTITGKYDIVTWIAPATADDYTITVDVSDSKLSIQASVTIIVAPAGMVLIPAGEFQMGDSLDGMNNALPVHTVYLDAFYMDIYEVTTAQYQKFMEATGYRFWYMEDIYDAPEKPVVGVSWFDAVAYAGWAGKRLPTEAEWEKAARGGLSGKRYPWGDEISHDDASGADGTSPVGSFAPNGYGLYDMAGNVWEWCADWYDADYYSSSPKRNPAGPSSGKRRVLRGGSEGLTPLPDLLRVAGRLSGNPTMGIGDLGFRCVSQD